jgi:hypothetical protein
LRTRAASQQGQIPAGHTGGSALRPSIERLTPHAISFLSKEVLLEKKDYGVSRTQVLAAATAMVLSGSISQAATFSVETDFLAGVTGNTETFNDNTFSTRASAIRPDFTVSETGRDPGITTQFNPIPSPNGTASLQFFLQSDATLRFDSFSAPFVSAFGLTVFSNGSGNIDVTVNDTDTLSFALNTTGTTFFGLTETGGISSISFGGDSIEDVFTGVDDVTTGSITPAVIPLPASGLLLIAGLGMLALGRRRFA